MGHDLKFVEFSEIEQKKIEEVIARDEELRNIEHSRICTKESEIDNLNNKVDLLSKDNYFKENHCLQCFSQFMIFFNPKCACSKCQRNYCKKCLLLIEKDIMLCLFCRKKMATESQKNVWFYENVKNKFKNFGSEKIKRMLSRGKSEGEDNDEDSYERITLSKRPSFGDIFSAFRTSTDNVSDSGFSTASSRRNLTLLPDLNPPSRDPVELSKDVDLEVMVKEDSNRSSWNLTPVKNRIPFSYRDNYSISSHVDDINNNTEQRPVSRRSIERGSSLSSEISDDIIDDIVTNNQFFEVPRSTRSNTQPSPVVSALRQHQSFSSRTSTPPLLPQVHLIDGDSPVFLQLPQDVEVSAGEAAEFVCAVEGTLPIEVYWYREGEELIRIDENESEKYVVSKAGRSHGFVVMETSTSDRGYYMCIAVNDYGRKEHMVKLTVLDDAATHAIAAIPEARASQKLDIFVPPVAQPRLSRAISTEVIRCGDFSVTTEVPSKPRQHFPDIDFVPLSKNEIMEVERDDTSSRNIPRSFNSSPYAASSNDDDHVFQASFSSEQKHTSEMRKQIRSNEIKKNSSELLRPSSQEINKQNINLFTNDKSAESNHSPLRYSNDLQIDSEQDQDKSSYKIQKNNSTKIHSPLFNNSTNEVSSVNARASSPLIVSRTTRTNQSRSHYINSDHSSSSDTFDPNNLAPRPKSPLFNSSQNNVGLHIYNQNLKKDSALRLSLDKPRDEYVAKEEGSFVIKSTANKRYENYINENESLNGNDYEEGLFYSQIKDRSEYLRPSVKYLTKKFSDK